MKKYILTLKHDTGKVKISINAENEEQAKNLVMKSENCPPQPIIKVRANKYIIEHIVQGFYGYGWEDLTSSENRKEARNDLKAYRENDKAPTRLITRRLLNN